MDEVNILQCNGIILYLSSAWLSLNELRKLVSVPGFKDYIMKFVGDNLYWILMISHRSNVKLNYTNKLVNTCGKAVRLYKSKLLLSWDLFIYNSCETQEGIREFFRITPRNYNNVGLTDLIYKYFKQMKLDMIICIIDESISARRKRKHLFEIDNDPNNDTLMAINFDHKGLMRIILECATKFQQLDIIKYICK